MRVYRSARRTVMRNKNFNGASSSVTRKKIKGVSKAVL